MPLHLLGKKSWNVYNQANVERVRRDEEQARQAQQEAERRQRDNDAADQLALLRGEQPQSQLQSQLQPQSPSIVHAERETVPFQSSAKKRKRDNHVDQPSTDLSDQPRSAQPAPSTVNLDNITNLRLRDAAGRNAHEQKPWYSSLASTTDPNANTVTTTDVFGNLDPSRSVRNQMRLNASDPLLAMKKGVKQLREVERQKDEWRREREQDIGGFDEETRRRERRRKRREKDERLVMTGTEKPHKKKRREDEHRDRRSVNIPYEKDRHRHERDLNPYKSCTSRARSRSHSPAR